MLTRVENHPGGVAVLVPEALATEAGIRGGEPAEIEVAGGRLVVRAAPLGTGTLADLLARVTPGNLHGEWASGPSAGAELL